ncbi:hypothetical protein [Methylobacterium brachythecii]|uniref:Proteophosphoglycan ppg4 n=1 Tax=Methylobacterium brachythecii TaxID=1176177 RepID=A0A7W6AK11_9HYPH|nr:hypothetical protein [Methylobacterium brachythecii]MBB3904842.1 hypothetical protein [Methylobacterium brachythecii]GLS45394.1 hypothetical protein GCM10007884_33840 [Methylobacterium brachythecii]
MYRTTSAVAALLFAAAPAFAQSDRGNAAQPNQPVPQTGQTSGGPRQTPPAPEPMPGPGTSGAATNAGAVDSAKGGNAAQTNKPVPNVGGTSGGPAR